MSIQDYPSRLSDPQSRKAETFSYLPKMTAEQIKAQVQYIIDKGWNPAIEHSEPENAFSYYWYMWKLPMFGETDADAVRYGAFDYISKPVNKETLLRFVRQALNHWQLKKEKNRLLRENEKYRRYLEVIFSSVSDAIITVDEQTNIVQLQCR